MNDLLKIIVDAELKKSTSLEASLDAIIESYTKKKIPIEVEVTSKGGKTDIVDDKIVKELEKTVKSLQEKIGSLEKQVSKAFLKGKENAEGMSKAVDNALKSSKKIKLGSDGENTTITKDVIGNKYKTNSQTSVDGKTREIEMVNNYKELTKLHDSLLDGSKKWEGINDKNAENFKEMLHYLKQYQVVKGKGKGNQLDFGSEEFIKQTKIVQDEYDRLQAEEKHFQMLIKERDKLLKNLERLEKSEKKLVDDKEIRKVKKDTTGMKDLKTISGMETRLTKVSELYDELIKKNSRLVKEQNYRSKNTNTLEEKMPFVNQRFNNVKQWVDGSKDDWINEKEFERVENIFKGLNVEAKDFKVQLKMAEQELRSLEKHAQGLSNLQDAQNDTRKRQNQEIKKNRHLENAYYMGKRNVIPVDDIGKFQDMVNAIDMSSTKKDIEAVNVEWRRLMQLERDAVKLQKEKDRFDKNEQQNLKTRESAVNSLTESMKNLQASTERAFKGRQIDPKHYDKLKEELVKVNNEIYRIEKSTGELDDETKKSVNNQINDIKRLMAEYKQKDQMQRQALADNQRIDVAHRKQGVLSSGEAQYYNSNIDFDKLRKDDIRGNQEEIQRQVADTTKALLKQQGVYGKIDESMVRVKGGINNLGEEIYKVVYTVDKGDRQFEDFELTLNATNKQIRDLGQNMRQLRPQMTAMEQFGQAMGKVPIWGLATGIVYGGMQQIQMGFDMILEFDRAMVNLRKVAGESREELVAFESDAHDLGQTLGVTASEVVRSTTEFARLGYELQEAQGLAQNALIYANVGDMNVEDASQSIVSAIKGFGVAEEETVEMSKKYVDIFNEVSNNFAISADGIGEALRRSSAILHQSGNSIEQSVALITAANTTIQDPKVVGTALKTISMRIRGVDEEGQKIIGLIPEMEKYFNRFGSSVMEDADTFKSTYDIMQELADNWEHLTDVQQAQITELIGGKRQGSIVSAMIENWADATGSYEHALNSAGSAQQEFNKYTDSYQYKINRLKASTEDFWNTFYDSNAVKTAIDGLNQLVKALTLLTETLGMLPMLTGFFMTFLAMSNPATRRMVMFGEGTKRLGDIFKHTGKLALGFFGIIKNFLRLSIPFMALTVGVDLLSSALFKASRAREENLRVMKDEQEQAKQLLDSYRSMEEAGSIDRFKELSTADEGSLNVQERKELMDLQNQLIGIMPQVVDYYDDEHNAVLKTADEIERLIKLKEKEQILNNAKVAEESINEYDFSKIEGAVIELQKVESMMNDKRATEKGASFIQEWYEGIKNDLKNMDMSEIQSEYNKMMDDLKESLGEDSDLFMSAFNDISVGLGSESGRKVVEEYLDGLINSVEDKSGKLTESFNKAKSDLSSSVADLTPLINDLSTKFLEEQGTALSGSEVTFVHQFAENFALGLAEVKANGGDMIEYLNSFESEVSGALGAMKDDSFNLDYIFEGAGDLAEIERFEELANSKKVTAEQSEVLKAMVKGLKDEYADLTREVDETTESFELSKSEMATLTQQYENAVSDITFLNSTLHELKENHQLNADTMGQLAQRFPELLSYMGDEVGMQKAIENAIVQQTNVAKDSMHQKLMADENYLKSALDGHADYFKEIGELYGVNFQGAKNLAEAKARVDNELIKQLSGAWAKYYSQTADGMYKLSVAGQALMETNGGAMNGFKMSVYNRMSGVNSQLQEVANGFKSITMGSIGISTDFSSLGVPKSGGKKKKDSSKDEPSYKDWMEAWIEEKMQHAERLDMQEEEIKNKIKMYEEEENYAKVLAEQNKLISNRQGKIKELQKVNGQIQSQMEKYNQGWVDADGDATMSYINAYNKASKSKQEAMEQDFQRLSALKKAYAENAEEISSLGYEVKSLQKEFEELRVDKLTDDMDKLADSIDEAWKAFQRLKADLERDFSYLDEDDDAGRVALIDKRLDLLEKERKLIIDNIGKLKAQRATLEGQTELLKENAEEITEWEEALKDLNIEVIDSQNEVKAIYEELANDVIQQYKDAIERQKDAEIEAIEEAQEAEKERHEERMKNLDDEMDAFEKSIRQQLDAIDEQEEADDFDESLSEKQIERQEILNKINQYSMDNTAEGRKQLSLLQEQLSAKEKEIAEFTHDRQIELRKDALNKALETKREEVEGIKTEEDKLHEERLAGYEKEREDLNKHYENLLADERRWNQIRTDIMNENFDTIIADMKTFADQASAEAVRLGDNISKNINEELQKSIDLMAKLKQDKLKAEEINKKPEKPKPVPPKPAPKPVTKPTPKPVPKPSSGGSSGGSDSSGGSGLSAGSLPLRKRSGGFAVPRGGWDKYSVVDYLKSKSYFADYSDREKLYKALFNKSDYSGSNSQNTQMLSKLKTVQGLRSGGMTPAWGESGKLAFLHEKELVLNKFDTNNILQAVEMVRDIQKLVPAMKPSITPPDNNTENTKSGDIYLNFKIDRLEGGEKGAKTLVNKVNDALKRRGVNKI